MNNIITTLLTVPAALIALTVHECAHGYAAYKLGDPTARSLGRLSLNPLHHIDLVGALCMIFFRFGWAKPVPINARYFKHPRRDMAITALCGPLSNFMLAFLGAFLYVAFGALLATVLPRAELPRFASLFLQYTLAFLYIFHFCNLTLGLFNCLPIPPLDGSRFILPLLPAPIYEKVARYEPYISLILMLLLFFGILTSPLSRLATWLSGGMCALFEPIF